jgi:hypothetical protein
MVALLLDCLTVEDGIERPSLNAANNYQSALCTVSEQGRSHIQVRRDRELKLRRLLYFDTAHFCAADDVEYSYKVCMLKFKIFI